MKVLVLHSFNIFSDQSAASNRWRTLIEGLAFHNIKFLYVITSGYKSLIEKQTYEKTGQINNRIPYLYLLCQNRYKYVIARINIYLLNWIYTYYNATVLRKLVKSFKPDYVLLNPTYDAMLTFNRAFPRKLTDFKLVTELNEYNDIWDIHSTNRLQILRNKKFNSLLKNKIFPKLDICLVMTDVLINHYKKFSGLKETIAFLKVPMTVDLRRFDGISIKKQYGRPYIAYCGSGGFYTNGLDILIRSFSLIAPEFPDLRLYIAAFWGQDGDRMIELIHETKMKEKITYLGILEREEIPSFLFGAEVLVLPRPKSRQAKGGFPTKLGEYLATGKPVCASKVGEIPDYLVDGVSAYLCEPGNIESLADSLRRALINKEEAARIGLNGKRIAYLNFNMKFQAKRIFEFLSIQLT